MAELTWVGITDVVYYGDESPKFCYKFPEVWEFQKTAQFSIVDFEGIHNRVRDNSTYECRIYIDFAGERGFFSQYSQMTAVRICNNIQIVQVNMNSEILSYNSVRKPCGEGRRVDCILNCQD